MRRNRRLGAAAFPRRDSGAGHRAGGGRIRDGLAAGTSTPGGIGWGWKIIRSKSSIVSVGGSLAGAAKSSPGPGRYRSRGPLPPPARAGRSPPPRRRSYLAGAREPLHRRFEQADAGLQGAIDVGFHRSLVTQIDDEDRSQPPRARHCATGSGALTAPAGAVIWRMAAERPREEAAMNDRRDIRYRSKFPAAARRAGPAVRRGAFAITAVVFFFVSAVWIHHRNAQEIDRVHPDEEHTVIYGTHRLDPFDGDVTVMQSGELNRWVVRLLYPFSIYYMNGKMGGEHTVTRLAVSRGVLPQGTLALGERACRSESPGLRFFQRSMLGFLSLLSIRNAHGSAAPPVRPCGRRGLRRAASVRKYCVRKFSRILQPHYARNRIQRRAIHAVVLRRAKVVDLRPVRRGGVPRPCPPRSPAFSSPGRCLRMSPPWLGPPGRPEGDRRGRLPGVRAGVRRGDQLAGGVLFRARQRHTGERLSLRHRAWRHRRRRVGVCPPDRGRRRLRRDPAIRGRRDLSPRAAGTRPRLRLRTDCAHRDRGFSDVELRHILESERSGRLCRHEFRRRLGGRENSSKRERARNGAPASPRRSALRFSPRARDTARSRRRPRAEGSSRRRRRGCPSARASASSGYRSATCENSSTGTTPCFSRGCGAPSTCPKTPRHSTNTWLTSASSSCAGAKASR